MELVTYDRHDAVAVITLNRPPVNALNRGLIADIGEALNLASSDDIRSVVITGSPHFAAGADISGFQETMEAGSSEGQASALSDVVTRLAQLEKPVIAAVHGYALGGGLELAMGADFRYFGRSSKVGQPEIKLGLIPGAGGTQRLARIVGPQRCRELCMSGRHVEADEALAIGLADRVVDDPDLLDVAIADATDFATGPTVAYGAVKRAIDGGFGRSLEEGLAIEAEEFGRAFASGDARIGVRAFLEKEPPSFAGT